MPRSGTRCKTNPSRFLRKAPLTLVAYECGLMTRAYIEPIAVGDSLPNMPLFIEPDNYVEVPLEQTYQAAFAGMPHRWRGVLSKVQ